MIHLVTFADESMSRARQLCADSAIRHGVNQVHLCSPEFPTTERGYGFWRWKPEMIIDRMNGTEFVDPLKDGEILIYSDAGIEFINSVSHIIERMDQDIFLFGNNWEHAHWCKRDIVQCVWPTGNDAPPDETVVLDPRPWSDFGKQVQASVIFFRVSDYSRKFVAEWLQWCLFEGGRLIDDSPSRVPNHPEFRENRHDQAILTTLAYREGIKLHYWPSVYNKGGSPEFVYDKLPEYQSDDYPVLFSHHRKRNHEWSEAA